MSRPLRIFEGRFGRLILAEAPDFFGAGESTAPVIIFKHQGADCTLRIGDTPVALTRDDVIFVEPLEAHGGDGAPGAGATRVIEFHPSPEWLHEAFPESFQPIGGRIFAHAREAITPRMRQLADTLAIEALNDQFLSPERLEFMLQELMIAVVENYLARRRAGAARASPTRASARRWGCCGRAPTRTSTSTTWRARSACRARAFTTCFS